MLSADDPTAAAWTRATTNLAYVARRIVEVGLEPISAEVCDHRHEQLVRGVKAPTKDIRSVVHVYDVEFTRLRVFGTGRMPPLVVKQEQLGFTLRNVWVFSLTSKRP